MCEFSLSLSQSQIEGLLVNIYWRGVDVGLLSLGLCDPFSSICGREPERHRLKPDCALTQSYLAVVVWILCLDVRSPN